MVNDQENKIKEYLKKKIFKKENLSNIYRKDIFKYSNIDSISILKLIILIETK